MAITKTLALTAYGLVGWDWVRMTAALTDTGSVVMVRINRPGDYTVLPTLPETYRTSGDMANVMAQLEHNVNASAVPSVGLPNHQWKGTFDLDGIAAKFGVDPAFVQALRNSYSDVEEAAA